MKMKVYVILEKFLFDNVSTISNTTFFDKNKAVEYLKSNYSKIEQLDTKGNFFRRNFRIFEIRELFSGDLPW